MGTQIHDLHVYTEYSILRCLCFMVGSTKRLWNVQPLSMRNTLNKRYKHIGLGLLDYSRAVCSIALLHLDRIANALVEEQLDKDLVVLLRSLKE